MICQGDICMLKTMKAFSVSARPEVMKKLDTIAEKHNIKRSTLARAILVVALKDKDLLQKALEIL